MFSATFKRWFAIALWQGSWCCVLTLTAQAQYRFDHWTADNGLPQNSVRDIVQTRDGYLWLTTFDGLVRFDGVRFTVFNKSNSPGIITNRFTYLYEDGQGDLWATTENSGLTRRHNGRFTTYSTEQGLPGNRVSSIGGDGYGGVLLFFERNLFRWAAGKFLPADELRITGQAGLLDHYQHAICHGDSSELRCFVDGQVRSWSAAEFPPGLALTSPVQDEQGNLWFGSNDGLVKVREGREVHRFTARDGLPGNQTQIIYGSQPLQALVKADDGSLWLTEVASLKSHRILPQIPEGLELGPTYGDREGNFWIATYGKGLYRLRPQAVTAYAKAQGLKADEIYPITEDHAGAIWIGSAGDGLFRFQGGVFTQYNRVPVPFWNSINSLFEDRAGHLWANGRLRFEAGHLTRRISEAVLPDALDACWTMYEEQDGASWYGTVHGVVRCKDGISTLFTTKDGLAGDDTKVIIGDVNGGLWLGSTGGLTHYQNREFKAWTERDGLPGNTVRALKQDRDGTLWIGTYDSGLGRFKDGRFTRFTTKEGLFDNGVFQMLDDDYGWCWMSCNRGIYRVRQQELNDFAAGKISAINCLAYNKSDGMPSTECNGGRWPAGVKTRDGKLWFPTMEGVAIVDPANVKANSQPPPVVIEEMKINNQVVPDEAWDSAIRNPNSKLRILPGQDNFEIAYTALSFINSENMRFKYKLEGADADWVDAGTRRTAYFSHLAPGAYAFRVIAANADGVWNEAGARLQIQIVPPFYRTWWFLTLSALAVAGAVFAAFRYRVQQVEAREAAQQAFAQQLIESQEQERKRIAAELHDSLGQQLLVIKNWAMIGLNAPHDAAQPHEPLAEISTTASQAIEEVRQVVYDLRPYQLDKIGLANTLRFMVEKVGTAAGLEIQTEFGAIDELFSHNEQVTLYRIVQECVNNIVKHAQATAARVAITPQGETVRVLIEDNGRGFVAAQRQGSGFGLQGLHERVRMLKGEMTIHSEPGNGTKILITIERK